MRLISKPPFFLKYIVWPPFFILGIIFAAVDLFAPQHINGQQAMPFAVSLLFVAVAMTGGIITLIYVLSFADEVWDVGDALTVRRSRHRERIPLANIISLTHKVAKPPYSILSLRVPCRFGRTIRFMTILRGSSLEPDPALYDDLPVRINEARRHALRNKSAFPP